MSQFAELFKAVKNEPKNSPGNNENKKPAAIKNLKQVKDDNGAENKSGDALNSDAQNLQEEPKIVGSPKKIGKSSNTDFTQVLTYIRRDTHRQIKKVLIDDPDERDLSDLVEELLRGWLKKNV